jgi:hypothetical protein
VKWGCKIEVLSHQLVRIECEKDTKLWSPRRGW